MRSSLVLSRPDLDFLLHDWLKVDELSRRPTGADNRVMSAIRMAFDVTPAGWSGSDGSLAAQTLGRKA